MTTQSDGDTLAIALAEQLKNSLLHVVKLAEQPVISAEKIKLISQQSLRVIDAYTLGQDQTELPLEPLTTASVLYDAAQILDPIAKQFGYVLQVDSKGVHQPVLTNRQTLKDMLVLLASGLMQTNSASDSQPHIVLGTHRSRHGTVVGAFSNTHDINQATITRAKKLGGQAHQSLPGLTVGGGATLAIAMELSSRLQAPLKARRHTGLHGVGSLLAPSKQLSLVT